MKLFNTLIRTSSIIAAGLNLIAGNLDRSLLFLLMCAVAELEYEIKWRRQII